MKPFNIATLSYFSVSLDNVSVDITELDKGMDLTRREFEARSAGEREAPFIIKDFLANSEDKMKKLKTDLKSAKVRSRRGIPNSYMYIKNTRVKGLISSSILF